jgi:hypothetical protein
MIIFDQIQQLSQLQASPSRRHLFEWCDLAMKVHLVIHKMIGHPGITRLFSTTMFVLIQFCYTIPDLHAVRHHSSSTAVRTCLLLDGHEGFLLSKRWPQQNWRLGSSMPSSTIFQTLIRNSTLSSTSALELEVSNFTRYVNWILP